MNKALKAKLIWSLVTGDTRNHGEKILSTKSISSLETEEGPLTDLSQYKLKFLSPRGSPTCKQFILSKTSPDCER